MITSLRAYEAHGPRATLALCRRLAHLVAMHAHAAAVGVRAERVAMAWTRVRRKVEAVPRCEACGGVGTLAPPNARPVPCPACEGKS
jgi:hypothetical protein